MSWTNKYVEELYDKISECDERDILICAAATLGGDVAARMIRKYDRAPLFRVYEIRGKDGVLGWIGIARSPLWIVRGLSPSAAVYLFRVSSKIRGFRFPFSFIFVVNSDNMHGVIKLLLARYAGETLMLMETLHKSKTSLLARIHTRLRRRLYAKAREEDPLTTALDRCKTVLKRGRTPLARDLAVATSSGRTFIQLVDGEEGDPIRKNILRSVTIVDPDLGYVAHSCDLAAIRG